jgi:hypothetical protein
MQFISLYTPAAASNAPPDDALVAKMNRLVEDMFKSGVLVSTGGILSRNTGMKVVRNKGAVTVEHGAIAGSSLMPAAGYAIMRVDTREELAARVKEFLDVVGDGTCEIIQLMDAIEGARC